MLGEGRRTEDVEADDGRGAVEEGVHGRCTPVEGGSQSEQPLQHSGEACGCPSLAPAAFQ